MIEENTLPAQPVKTGNSHVDHAAQVKFEQQVAAVFAKGAPTSKPAIDPRYQKELDAFAATQKPSDDPRGNVAQFNADMRAAGMQRSDTPPDGTVDQKALKFLQDWRHANPKATTAQLTVFERDLSQVLEGRRYGETPAQFAERKANALPTQQPSTDAAANAPELTNEQRAAIDALLPHVDAEGGVLGKHLTPELTAGYTLPPDIEFDAEETLSMCANARAAGFTQADVNRFVEAQRRANS